MKIGIIGGGSVGLLIGGYLGRDHDITFYVRRKEQADLLNKNGVNVVGQQTTLVQAKLCKDLEREDLLIVSVKQPHIRQVHQYIRESHNNSPLLFLQNGMGHVEYFKQFAQPIYVGVVEHGAFRKEDTTVIHSGFGSIQIAMHTGDRKQLHLLVQHLNQLDFPVKLSPNWNELLVNKLVINAVINPLTALFQVKNIGVIENNAIQFLAKKLCNEACSVLHLNPLEQWERIKTIAYKTGANTSSMLEDINQGRKTEIEAISSYIRKKSTRDLPYTNFVYRSILALEEKKGISHE
ncbi:2-dehydropantoate 2-reductase [Virgibacillus sp. W0430]|uniref:2-dehydropantoate 2-reductase n=1 Tax=Virgibacillus sp. W0430 TaxID=3391580 RepID=UPI003F46D27E